MYKKAQGLSINVIIIVAIALIVLVVLIAVFTGRMGSFVGGIDQTATCEASCSSFQMDKAEPNNLASRADCNLLDRSRVVAGTYNDLAEGQVCCCKPGTTVAPSRTCISTGDPCAASNPRKLACCTVGKTCKDEDTNPLTEDKCA